MMNLEMENDLLDLLEKQEMYVGCYHESYSDEEDKLVEKLRQDFLAAKDCFLNKWVLITEECDS